jgi:hypothetical protein
MPSLNLLAVPSLLLSRREAHYCLISVILLRNCRMVVFLAIAVCHMQTVPVLLPHAIVTHFILAPLMMVVMIHVFPKMMPIPIKISPFIQAPWMMVPTIPVLPKMMTILMTKHFLLKV